MIDNQVGNLTHSQFLLDHGDSPGPRFDTKVGTLEEVTRVP